MLQRKPCPLPRIKAGVTLIQIECLKKMPKDPDMLDEYDFSKGIRGKYAKRYAEGTNIVVIEPDVAKIFPDHDSVNQALRSLAEIIKRQKKHA